MNVPPNDAAVALGRIELLLDGISEESVEAMYAIKLARGSLDPAVVLARTDAGLRAFAALTPIAVASPTEEEWMDDGEFGLFARVTTLRELLKVLVLTVIALRGGLKRRDVAYDIWHLIDSLTALEDDLSVGEEGV
jgi:hypothetical protein